MRAETCCNNNFIFILSNIAHLLVNEGIIQYEVCVLENRVLRRMFGPTRDEVTGEWRRLHNKELYALYSSPSISRCSNQQD